MKILKMPNKRKCIFCKEFKAREDGLITPIGFFCNIDHAARHARNKQNAAMERQLKKAKANQRKKDRERKKVFKDNDIKHQHRLTQSVFNRLRVLQEIKWFVDKGLIPECLSCGKKRDFCCGHFKTRGSQGNLRYDTTNTFLQCNRYCNMALSGNIEGNKNTRGYKKGLIERFGAEKAKEIIEYCETNAQSKKWSGLELKELRKKFNKQIRELTNGTAF